MKVNWIAVIGSAFGLGLLTSISPCPLATNIAAISFIIRQIGSRRIILLSGLLYTCGRTLTYLGLGMILTRGLLEIADVSHFLQKYGNEFLGPIMILLGMILFGWIGSGLAINLAGTGIQARAEKGGVLWAGLLGIIFTLSFCPVSAGLFFGGLIPLAVTAKSPIVVPGIYGVATALPVIFFAFLIAFSTEMIGKVFHRITQVEKFVRIGAAIFFIVAGVYYSLIHVYGISF